MKTLLVLALIAIAVLYMVRVALSMFRDKEEDSDSLESLQSSVSSDAEFILIVDKYNPQSYRFEPCAELGYDTLMEACEKARALDALDDDCSYIFGVFRRGDCYYENEHWIPCSEIFNLL